MAEMLLTEEDKLRMEAWTEYQQSDKRMSWDDYVANYINENSGGATTPAPTQPPSNDTGFVTNPGYQAPSPSSGGATETDPGATLDQQTQDYYNGQLQQLGQDYNTGKISYADYTTQTQSVMDAMRGGTYYTPYTSGSSSSGVVSGSSASSTKAYEDWYDSIMKARDDAMEKQEELYQQSKEAIDAAYQMGLMSETEYNNALTSAREGLESQYSNLKTQTTETLYGNVNKGALEGRLQDIDLSRISSLAGADRELYAQMQEQNAQAAKDKAAGYSNLFGQYQIPYPDIPAPTGSTGGTYTGSGTSTSGGTTGGGTTSSGEGYWSYNAGGGAGNEWTWIPTTAESQTDPYSSNFDSSQYAMMLGIDPAQFEGWTQQDFMNFNMAVQSYGGKGGTSTWGGTIPQEILTQIGKGTTDPWKGYTYAGGGGGFDEKTGLYTYPDGTTGTSPTQPQPTEKESNTVTSYDYDPVTGQYNTYDYSSKGTFDPATAIYTYPDGTTGTTPYKTTGTGTATATPTGTAPITQQTFPTNPPVYSQLNPAPTTPAPTPPPTIGTTSSVAKDSYSGKTWDEKTGLWI